MVGVLFDFKDADPVHQVFWTVIWNGIIAASIVAALMLAAQRRSVMGAHVLKPAMRACGWLADAPKTAAS